ncbi:hypothetical protein F2Q65_06410 [Thiohalocapsa marina]|uniref:Uncharacterized protein n=1 Tax=Thiohalocapsa marina TaxID=424902 RepID=A0A5M8FMN2_9GAMM|nr:hypothetical protein [Thiohalocapsa marina]KAA6185997.1 hypothetical protein F2Q65_06410 [Thiohalocapsa marina]
MILDTLHRLARRLRPVAPALATIGLLLLAASVGLLLWRQEQASDVMLLPAIAGMLWCLFGYLFIRSFERVPAPPDPAARGWRRLKARLARGWHGLLALVFGGVTLWALWITVWILREAIG